MQQRPVSHPHSSNRRCRIGGIDCYYDCAPNNRQTAQMSRADEWNLGRIERGFGGDAEDYEQQRK
jgi:hypothetical protein